ncbi:hypothetical protein ACP8HZ_01250 [Francisella noatunensis]
MKAVVDITKQYGANIAASMPINIVKGENAYVYDGLGKNILIWQQVFHL